MTFLKSLSRPLNLMACVSVITFGGVTFAGFGQANAQSAFELYQDRLVALEESLKDVRGMVEEDLRSLKQAIEDGTGDSEEVAELKNRMDKIIDRLGSLNNRIERTLEVASDNEFRLLRMEKRLDSLMRMGIEGGLGQLQQPTSPSGIGAGDVPQAGLSVNENNETVWTMGADSLNEEINNLPNPEDANHVETSSDNGSGDAAGQTATAGDDTAETVVSEDEPTETAVKASVLPDVSPDEQYRFALGKALQNDLVMAEDALAEFITTNPEHTRTNDATFWLGRVQFMQGSYEQAAMTFTEFNTTWPTDARREKTTLWIAESISYFAPAEEICDLLASLPSLIEDPTDNFFTRLDGLKQKSQCGG